VGWLELLVEGLSPAAPHLVQTINQLLLDGGERLHELIRGSRV